VLGNLFKTKSINRANTELLVLITPELVRPIPTDQAAPVLTFKEPFMPRNSEIPMSQPGMDKTGPVAVHPPTPSVPVEQLVQQQKQGQQAPAAATEPQAIRLVPIVGQPNVNPGVTPTPMPGTGSGGH
jgi:pilus assembly protein CpaC